MGYDIKTEFTEILQKLPEDKRQELFQKLKKMPPEQRNEAVRMLVERNRSSKTHSSSEANASVQASLTASFTEEQHPPKRKLKKKYRNMLIAIVAAVVLIIGGIVLFATDLLGNGTGKETDGTESSVTKPSVIEKLETTPSSTPTPTETPTPTPSPSPTPTPYPIKEDAPDLTGITICIDPGHQQVADKTTESCATWLSAEKARCTSGSVGVVTGKGEYEVTLDASKILKAYLEQCGATVYMTREENDVNMSNQERAQFAVDCGADIFIRIHADAANDSMASGVRVFVPDSGDYSSKAVTWGDKLGELVAEAEGLEFIGTNATHNYTGLNYANSIPSFQISLGYMSNSDDEALIVKEETQLEAAAAIAQFCRYITDNK